MKICDGTAEHPPTLRIGERILERSLHHASGASGGLNSTAGESGHRVIEALALAVLLPDEILRGHEEVIEE